MAAVTTFFVDYDIPSTTRATVRLEGADTAAVDRQSDSVNVVITYHVEQNRVIVKMSPTNTAHGSVRSACAGLPPGISTGFSATNLGLLASVINTASEVLVFAGPSRLRPISAEAVFKRSTHHQSLVKITISDSGIFTPSLKASVIAKTELSLYKSRKLEPGTLFCFLIKTSVLGGDFSETMILSAKNSGDKFTVPRRLARKLLQIFKKDSHSLTLSVSYIPRPLLLLLQFKLEVNLSSRAEMVRDLMVRPSVFILSVLEWLPYFWVEEIAVWGCRILGNRIDFDMKSAHGLYNVALSLGMEQFFPM